MLNGVLILQGIMWKLCPFTRHPALLVYIVLEIFIHSVNGKYKCSV